MAYRRPAWSVTVALSTVALCGVVSLMIRCPSIQSCTVSSETVMNVYASLNRGWMVPVQRAAKLSVGIAGAGEPLYRQAKLSVRSVRVTAGGPVNVVFFQYCAVRPVPVPVTAGGLVVLN